MSSFIKHCHSFLRLAFILTVFGLLYGCSSDEVKEDPYANWSAKDFYTEASNDLRLAEFETAIKKLETLEARYPFSSYAKQAQLDVAYAYYKFDEPDSAISAVNRFIRLHPRNPHIDYAIYLKGLANFYRGGNILDMIFPRDLSEHDPKNLKQAMNDFNDLIRRYPESIYAPDAYLRSLYLHNKLAEAEIRAADYYMRREAWVGAVNRAQNVIKYYQRSPARNRALDIMITAYGKLGMDKLAEDSRLIRKMNPSVKTESLTEQQTKELKQNKTLVTPAVK
ncbi:MAG: outer membrane protein assembly factor BamD [Gammaproteobacteria bacterium]|nr:outer membrane protein assembly factor BamD [Gammaproteobacteria bacterium]